MINYLSGITGYVVINDINPEFSSIAGIVFIVGGLMLFIVGRHMPEKNNFSVNEEKSIRKIKLAFRTKLINYERLRRLVIEAGYKFVEAKDYTTVFSPNYEIIKDETGHPLVIRADNKNDKNILLKILKGIIDNSQR